jgi:hypothetical protein
MAQTDSLKTERLSGRIDPKLKAAAIRRAEQLKLKGGLNEYIDRLMVRDIEGYKVSVDRVPRHLKAA